jgi:hypothetical protein
LSSILDSLKKLENELTEQSNGQFRPEKRPAPKAISQRLKNTRFFNNRSFIIFAVIISAAGTWFILNGKPGENAPTWVAPTQTKPEKSVGLAKEQAALPDRPQNKISANADAKQSESLTKTAKAASLSARPPRKQAPVSVAQPEIKPAKSLSRPEPKASLPDLPQKKTATPKNITPGAQNTKARRVAAIPVKQDDESRLRIQAIAWSSDPQERIAVINDRILREGESMEGVLVTHIGKDEVVFRKGSEQWRQLFRL